MAREPGARSVEAAMVFIAIALVLLVYIGLYLLWDQANISTQGAEGVLHSLVKALVRPENEVFFILRSLLLLTIVYLVADHFFVGAKRVLKRKRDEPTTVQPTFRETDDHIYRDS